jgi:hypothetical protein
VICMGSSPWSREREAFRTVLVGSGQGQPRCDRDGQRERASHIADLTPIAPYVPPLAATGITTKQSSGASSGSSISIRAGTVGETDRATITGTNAHIAGGTVHYQLYSKSNCDPGASELFDGGSKAVTNGVGAPSSPSTSALSPGKYYWQAQYSGDVSNKPVTSVCGTEVLTVTSAVTIPAHGSSNGNAITVPIGCKSSSTCKLTVAITETELVKDVRFTKNKKHEKTISLASGKFTVKSGKTNKLAIRLTRAGKRALASHKGHLKASILVSDKTAGGVVKVSQTISITTVKKKHER